MPELTGRTDSQWVAVGLALVVVWSPLIVAVSAGAPVDGSGARANHHGDSESRDASSVDDLGLSRARPPGSYVSGRSAGAVHSTVTYQVRTGSGWTAPRNFGTHPDLAATQVRVAGTGGTDLVGVLTARDGDASGRDVYAVDATVGADLVVNATASARSPVRVGAPTTVNYTVRNVGSRTSGPATVAIANRTGTIATARMPALSASERVTGNVTVSLGRAGAVRVTADAGDAVLEGEESNNDAVAVAARPDLDVVTATDRLRSDRLRVRIRLHNDGAVPAIDVPYRVRIGNETRTATLDGIGAGRNLTTTVTVPADAVDTAASLDVRVDPTDRIAESNESNNAFAGRVRELDLQAPSGGATIRNTSNGDRLASFTLRNTDTGSKTAVVSVATGETTTHYRVPIPSARGPEYVAAVPVSLRLPDGTVRPRSRLKIAIDSGRVDVDVTDNVVRTTVDAIEQPPAEPPALTITNATATAGGNGSIEVTLRNTDSTTVGETLRISQAATGRVVTTQPVAVPPDTNRTVHLGVPNATGNLSVATATDVATVNVADTPVDRADLDGDGEISTDELQRAIAKWVTGKIDTEALQATIRAWVASGDD